MASVGIIFGFTTARMVSNGREKNYYLKTSAAPMLFFVGIWWFSTESNYFQYVLSGKHKL